MKRDLSVFLCTDPGKLLSCEAFEVYSTCMYKPTFDKYIEKMSSYLDSSDVNIYLCEEDGAVAGMLVTDHSGEITEIMGIAVASDRRKCGIGRKLINFALESENTDKLKAETDDDAVGFYRSCGFKTEMFRTEYPDGVAVRYECCLCK